ncbi:hypothetical protein MRB53_009904 [Persea americana]|uniref:Uncharacterized protein n=1 Tax=Persea americana TaxID=3435 RepID=A0ACC2LQD6_PERAE|nr:hypothetical protein MRB53_009904 [Persea americana]
MAPASEHETGTREVELQDASPENGEPENAETGHEEAENGENGEPENTESPHSSVPEDPPLPENVPKLLGHEGLKGIHLYFKEVGVQHEEQVAVVMVLL